MEIRVSRVRRLLRRFFYAEIIETRAPIFLTDDGFVLGKEFDVS